jgi:hypothetical protein
MSNYSISMHQRASRRVQRCDALIASTVLVFLLAGWVMNFVDAKQVTLSVSSFLMGHFARQT